LRAGGQHMAYLDVLCRLLLLRFPCESLCRLLDFTALLPGPCHLLQQLPLCAVLFETPFEVHLALFQKLLCDCIVLLENKSHVESIHELEDGKLAVGADGVRVNLDGLVQLLTTVAQQIFFLGNIIFHKCELKEARAPGCST